MSVNVPVSSKIPLFINVGDGNENLFVCATVTDSDGIELSQSPITLLSYGNGQYGYDDLIMPDVEYISVVYDIFNDALFNIKSNYYSVTEVFPKLSHGDNNDYLSNLQDNYVEVMVDSTFDEIDVLVGKK